MFKLELLILFLINGIIEICVRYLKNILRVVYIPNDQTLRLKNCKYIYKKQKLILKKKKIFRDLLKKDQNPPFKKKAVL